MKIFDKDQSMFESYWHTFRVRYCRHLLKKDKDDTNYAYKKCSQRKKTIYAYWNEWLNTRDGGDDHFTILYDNCQSFSMGALYQVDAGNGRHIGVFIVVTPSKVYEWYVNYNSTWAVYLGKVPAHRTEAHLERTDHTEQYLDNEQVSLALKGAGYYYG